MLGERASTPPTGASSKTSLQTRQDFSMMPVVCARRRLLGWLVGLEIGQPNSCFPAIADRTRKPFDRCDYEAFIGFTLNREFGQYGLAL